MKRIVIIIVFIAQSIHAQKLTTNNIVVDFENSQPISNVNVFNSINSTITNNDGLFTFNSDLNSITISHLGYEDINTNFTNLNINDTIFLKQNKTLLKEVVITDNKQLINNVYDNVALNYPFESFTEEAFVRCILRKNDKIIKFQDMVVNLGRNTLFTNNNIKKIECNLQILDLRKAGIVSKSSREPDFKLLSINELLNWYSAIFTIPQYYSYQTNRSFDNNYLKIDFLKKENQTLQESLEGYYVINIDDFALQELNYKTVFEDETKIPFNENKNVKWRTIGKELFIQYKKNVEQNKYFINNGLLKNIVEVIINDTKSIYEASYHIVSLKNNKKNIVKSNFSTTKDLFKADIKFNSTFWEGQNQLILDNELKDFIKNLDGYKKEYDIYSNFK